MSASEFVVRNAPATPWSVRATIRSAPSGAAPARSGGERRSRPRPQTNARPAPVAVSDRPGRQVERRERERVGEDDPLLPGEAEVEVALDRRQRDEDDRGVDERERGADDAGGEGQPAAGLSA